MNLIHTKRNFDYVVCKHDKSPMKYIVNRADPKKVGMLICTKCEEKYLVVNNIILTSEILMGEKDKKLADCFWKEELNHERHD